MNEKKEIKISLTTFIVGIIAIVLLVLVIVMGMYIATQSKEPHKQESQVIEKNENKIIIASKQNDEKVNDVQEIELENSNLNPWFLGKSSETSLREIEDRISKDFSIIYKRRKSVCSV